MKKKIFWVIFLFLIVGIIIVFSGCSSDETSHTTDNIIYNGLIYHECSMQFDDEDKVQFDGLQVSGIVEGNQ